jgi:energy-coupling factor transporter ATP-binding protein EcfA2
LSTNYHFNEISEVDSLEQKQLFLVQKYKKLVVEEWDLSAINGAFGTKLTQSVNKPVSIFDIFKQIGNNELLMKKILGYLLKERVTIEYNGKTLWVSDIQSTQKTILTAFAKQLQTEITLCMHDLQQYANYENQLIAKKKTSISVHGEEIGLDSVVSYYRKQILAWIRQNMKAEKIQGAEIEGELDDFLQEMLGLVPNTETQFQNAEIKELIWKYTLFRKVQNGMKHGYVFSHRELMMMEDIWSDLKRWEIVLLTGDTGSGKTEIAKYICKYFLERDYVFVSGSKELEVSDLTLEKQVTSRSRVTTSQNIVDKKNTSKENPILEEAVAFFDELTNLKAFSDAVKMRANGDEELKSQFQTLLSSGKLLDKSLITEYHYMGLYLAAKNGLPLILDEVNIIRPEVLMALNDVITKKAGQTIQLPNGLPNILVNEGFCVILTGNDPEQNKKAGKYKSWRYEFDEAFYNRLRKYAKGYFNQINKTKEEYGLDGEKAEDTLAYLYNNEMYGVILMLLFRDGTTLMESGKYGFEIMKRDFSGETIGMEEFFEELKNFSKAINFIQRAFSGEVLSLSWSTSTVSLKDTISRDVFSMRNLLQVLTKFKDDTQSFEYHMYREFIEKVTNIDAKYSLLLIFKEFWFFGSLITDDKTNTIDNVYKFANEKRNQSRNITLEDIENKILISKQDIYKEYFWSLSISDENFEQVKESIEELHQNNQPNQDTGSENLVWIFDGLDVTPDTVGELIDSVRSKLFDHDDIFKLLPKEGELSFAEVDSLFDVLKSHILHEVPTGIESIKKLRKLNADIIKFNNLLDARSESTDESGDIDELLRMHLMSFQNEVNTTGVTVH